MTTREADKVIKSASPTTVHNTFHNETFTRIFTKRDRWNLYTDRGEKFDRGELKIINQT